MANVIKLFKLCFGKYLLKGSNMMYPLFDRDEKYEGTKSAKNILHHQSKFESKGIILHSKTLAIYTDSLVCPTKNNFINYKIYLHIRQFQITLMIDYEV